MLLNRTTHHYFNQFIESWGPALDCTALSMLRLLSPTQAFALKLFERFSSSKKRCIRYDYSHQDLNFVSNSGSLFAIFLTLYYWSEEKRKSFYIINTLRLNCIQRWKECNSESFILFLFFVDIAYNNLYTVMAWC